MGRKKVRFSDSVRVRDLGVSLKEHINEIKNPVEIIKKPPHTVDKKKVDINTNSISMKWYIIGIGVTIGISIALYYYFIRKKTVKKVTQDPLEVSTKVD